MSNTPVRWKKSSDAQLTCVEIAHTLTCLRDSKNPCGPTLSADAARLLSAVRAGRFDR
jgi:hypothetical protein